MKKGVSFLLGVVVIVISLTCAGIGGAFSQDISRAADDLAPYGTSVQPNGSTITLVAHELDGTLDAGADCVVASGDDILFKYLTFGHDTDPSTGKVPGPFIRVKAGNTHTLRLVNPAGNAFTHSIDFHAVKGFRGGGTVLMAAPGQEASLTVTLTHPGLFVYHCVGDGQLVNIAKHIAHGMYGLILVQPAKGGIHFMLDVRRAEKEFYIMRGEFYVDDPTCCEPRDWDVAKGLAEQPDYVVFNGRAGVSWEATGLPAPCAPPIAMNVNVNDDVIIYMGNIGPNQICSPHIIGDIFDREYHLGDLLSEPNRNIQTTVVPAAGAAAFAFKPLVSTGDTPSIILDHSVFRTAKGALGVMNVQ